MNLHRLSFSSVTSRWLFCSLTSNALKRKINYRRLRVFMLFRMVSLDSSWPSETSKISFSQLVISWVFWVSASSVLVLLSLETSRFALIHLLIHHVLYNSWIIVFFRTWRKWYFSKRYSGSLGVGVKDKGILLSECVSGSSGLKVKEFFSASESGLQCYPLLRHHYCRFLPPFNSWSLIFRMPSNSWNNSYA